MSKIGLCTFYDDNFGTCLQSFALEKTLFKYCDDVEIVRYVRDTNQKSSLFKRIMSKTPKQLLIAFKLRKRIVLWKRAFKEFRENNMVFSKEEYNRNLLLEQLVAQYDAFVCGSDMLWSEEFFDDWFFYYLGFVPKNNCIAYAPSFGKNEIYEDHFHVCKDLIDNIKFLSCREEAGVKMIKNLFEIECPQVLDPTLLLKKEEWEEHLNKEKLVNENYILTYLFGGINGERKKMLNILEKKLGCRVIHIPMTVDEYNSDAYKEKMGPFEFVRLFRDAQYIVTDTFHGTIFSIIFEKEFVVLDRKDKSKWAKYSDRMTSTLKMFNISERYIDSIDEIDINKKIDYKNVSRIIDEKRHFSLQYLKNALEECLNE